LYTLVHHHCILYEICAAISSLVQFGIFADGVLVDVKTLTLEILFQKSSVSGLILELKEKDGVISNHQLL
jgi:hypothetical protein